MLSSSRPDGMGPDGMGDHMGDHIMEGPGNFVELSYKWNCRITFILMVPPGGGRPEKR